jgi:tetratricopeptide (TPR) repeat protein
MTPPNLWKINLLGSFELEHKGQVVYRFEKRQEEQLLAYLAIAPATAHWREQIVADLWPGRDRLKSLRNLSFILWAIRNRLRENGLPDGIFVGARSFQLNPAVSTDIQDFERLAAEAVAADRTDDRVRSLLAALSAYKNGLLPGYDFLWLVAEQQRLATLAEDIRSAVSVAPAMSMSVTGPGHSAVSWPAAGHESAHGGAVPRGVVLDWRRVTALAEDAEVRLQGAERADCLNQLDEEWAVIQEHLDWALVHQERTRALAIAAPLWRYWYLRHRISEGRWYLGRLLLIDQLAPERLEAHALHAAGALAIKDGDALVARKCLNDSLVLSESIGDEPGALRTRSNLALLEYRAAAFPRAAELFGQVLSSARRLDDNAMVASALLNLAKIALYDEDYVRARGYLATRLELGQQDADANVVATSLAHLATVALGEKDFDSAEDQARQAAHLFADLQDLPISHSASGCWAGPPIRADSILAPWQPTSGR